MLDLMNKLSDFGLLFTYFYASKWMLTYKNEGEKNEKKIFLIIFISFTIISELSRNLIFKGIYYNSEYFNFSIFIVLALFYKYFYKIGYLKSMVFYYLFDVYFEVLRDGIFRFCFITITGYSQSSKEALLVSGFDHIKISIYADIVVIIICLLFRLLSNRFKLLDSEKRNYIYLSMALLANVINFFGRFIFGSHKATTTYIAHMLLKFRELVPVLSYEWQFFDLIITPKLLISSSIIIVLLFKKIIKENKLKIQDELIKSKLDMQYSHYLSIQESHNKVKRLYHDINNHIYCIDNLKNNSEEINEYINNLKDEIKEFKYIYNTENMILDIILNEKSTLCSKNKIKFTCDINLSKMDFIRPIDVSSIFSNILDNAIEACEKITNESIDKYIRIKGTITKSYFVLKCENSKINNVVRSKNHFLTDKNNKFEHGIGIESIKSSIKRYNGEIIFEDEKDKFMINILIPLNSKY